MNNVQTRELGTFLKWDVPINSLLSELKKHCGRGDTKTVKAGGYVWRTLRKQDLINTAGLLHI